MPRQLLDDVQLDFWGDKFVEHNLERYMPFHVFIANPQCYWDAIMGGEFRPLMIEQVEAQQRIDVACEGLETALAHLERQVENLRRIGNGRAYQPLKHHAHAR